MPTQGRYWTLDDYVSDFGKGVQAGAAVREQNLREKQLQQAIMERRELALERALAAAVHDQQFKAEQHRAAAQMGVTPVVGPNGQIDWGATQQLQAQDQIAEALGREHGITGGPTEIDTPTEQVMQLPGYQRGKLKAVAEMELLRFKNKAAEDLADRRTNAKRRGPPTLYPVEAGGRKIFLTENGAVFDPNGKHVPGAVATRVLDENKEWTGAWLLDGEVLHAPRKSEYELMMESGTPTPGAPSPAPNTTNAPASTGGIAPTRWRYNPATGKREPIQ